MRPSALLVTLLTLAIAMAGLSATYTSTPAVTNAVIIAPDPAAVKLAVLVVFDQLRGDYLESWRGLFGADGFARLQREGAWFTHCYYSYSITTTGPGHASILSGTCADRHGIINNEWFERDALAYCAGSTKYTLVPAAPPDPKARETRGRPKEVGSPERLLAETVADVLRQARPASKIFGLSLKDRSAILPVGQHPTGAYWFDDRFVTSSYYADGVLPWVSQFNSLADGGKLAGANKWFGKDWIPGSPSQIYQKWLDPSMTLPAAASGSDTLFQHSNTGNKPKPGKDYYRQLATSPAGNELLLELTKTCAVAEQLGQHSWPDLLVVSFSSNDLIGHEYGPDSPEVLDVTVRSDAIMAELLGFLDSHVGKGRYLLALTADHGVCPSVPASQKRGIPDAERVNLKKIQEQLENHLTTRFCGSNASKEGFKKPQWIDAFAANNASTFPWIYFNPKVAAVYGQSRQDVAQAAAEFLTHIPQVARTFQRSELMGSLAENDAIAARVKRSFHPERSGDLYVLLRPYSIPGGGSLSDWGTTHGTPYNYDTHVPLLVYGPGIPAGIQTEPITPQATAAIFSRGLGLRLPNKAEFPVPTGLR